MAPPVTQGQNSELNVANLLAQVAPGANIHAPRLPSNGQLQLNPDGSFKDAGIFTVNDDGSIGSSSRAEYFIPARR